jgi:2'-deoxynucleoside 5'-phosphate N-hydrolase
MKVYFGFTVAGDRSTIETACGVVRALEDLGHEVLTRHLVSDNAWEADRLISAQDVYRRDMAWLELCDIFIAEVSGSSFGLGFETGTCWVRRTRRSSFFIAANLKKRSLS